MIKDHEIIFAAIVSNIHQTGYGSVTPHACKSWANSDFVDQVLIVDGNSSDDTVLSIQNQVGEKFRLIKSSVTWLSTEWSWEILHIMENEIFDYVKNLENPNKIVVPISTDTVYDESSLKDLEKAISFLIEDKNSDYVSISFRKAITKRYVSSNYPYMNNWHITSATKFRKNIIWEKVGMNECYVQTNRNIQRLHYNFSSVPTSYDMFCFTKHDIQSKINRHVDFLNKKKPTVDQYIEMWLSKLKKLGAIRLANHSDLAAKFVENIVEDQFGYNLFGHIEKIK